LFPSNGSTAVYSKLTNLQLFNGNPNNLGHAFRDNGGTYLNHFGTALTGFKYGLTLDQTEVASFRDMTVEAQITRSLWIVNGNDLVAGVATATIAAGAVNAIAFTSCAGTYTAPPKVYILGGGAGVTSVATATAVLTAGVCTGITLTSGGAGYTVAPTIVFGNNQGFTNRLLFDDFEFNQSVTAPWQIVDDGGANHAFTNMNVNGPSGTPQNGMRFAGVSGLQYHNNECESHTLVPMQLTDTTLDQGIYVGPNYSMDVGGGSSFADIAASHIVVDAGIGGSIGDIVFAQATGQNINFTRSGANPSAGIQIGALSKGVTGQFRQAAPFLGGFGSVISNQIIRQTGQTYSTVAIAAGLNTVTPASMEGIYRGSNLVCLNEDGTNIETVFVQNTTGTTFTANFALAKNIKTGGWPIYATRPLTESAGTFAPVLVGSGVAGTFVYGANNICKWHRVSLSVIEFSGALAISSTSVAPTGNLSITGFPFTGENGVNEPSNIITINLYSGITFPAGFTQLSGLINPNTSAMLPYRSGSAVSSTQLQGADVAGALTIAFSGTMTTQTQSP
jgi:hypothetical protein